ncbi:MAG: hypothetical protein S4CHLAM7_15180 [Chlamydiae bacterium]|nr:hypothetical protein [Chlamydiota bacterium]
MKGLSRSIKPRGHSIGAKLFEELVVRSWWVLAFIILNFCVFKPILNHLESGESKLRMSLTQLQSKKYLALENKHRLELEIESLEDPLWVEMVLKQELGLVSEGQTKVHFTTP